MNTNENNSGTLKFSNPAVKEETKHTPELKFVLVHKTRPEHKDSWHIFTQPDENKMYETICFVEKLEHAKLIVSVTSLSKENQELKAENEELRRQSESDDKYIKSLEELKFELIDVLDRIIGSMSLERVERFDLNELAKSAITKAKAQ